MGGVAAAGKVVVFASVALNKYTIFGKHIHFLHALGVYFVHNVINFSIMLLSDSNFSSSNVILC